VRFNIFYGNLGLRIELGSKRKEETLAVAHSDTLFPTLPDVYFPILPKLGTVCHKLVRAQFSFKFESAFTGYCSMLKLRMSNLESEPACDVFLIKRELERIRIGSELAQLTSVYV